jgi:hypothetical protein
MQHLILANQTKNQLSSIKVTGCNNKLACVFSWNAILNKSAILWKFQKQKHMIYLWYLDSIFQFTVCRNTVYWQDICEFVDIDF